MSQASYGDLYENYVILDEEAKFAEEYITRLRNKDFAYIKGLTSKDILNQIMDDTLNTNGWLFSRRRPSLYRIKSFNGRFRDTCLNQHRFRDLNDARHIIDEWRHHYNHVRPHSSLGYIPPAVFAQQAA